MDLVKVWGNLLANYAVGTSICSIPTTYFVQGSTQVQLVAGPGPDGDSSSSGDNGLECGEDAEMIGEGGEGQEEEEEDDCEKEGCDGDNDKETRKEKKIQRVRYCREEYRCTLCPYTCTTEKAFLKHLRDCESKEAKKEEGDKEDKPRLSCPVCGKDRSGELSLEMHMRKHKDDKYFCCDICKFRTLQLKKLIQHRRMHTGERPHLCPFCSYRSARRDNLRSHVRRVHKKDNLPCDTFTPRSMLVTPRKTCQT